MTDPIMSYASVMRAQIDRLDAVAQNASNTNSAGYLQQSAVTSTDNFLSLLKSDTNRVPAEVFHSREVGSLGVTNRSTDVGMVSDDWFVLEGLDNIVTRNGRFSVTTEGYLQLGNHKVMGESGPISNINDSVTIRADGSIYVDNKFIDKLKLVSVSKDQMLTSLGNGIYLVNGELKNSQQAKVVQGALTGSNVSLETDMTKMIEITRHVEMLQRAMSAYDDMLDTGINQLGK
jgi:flagellar basal-body rod protein FlgF